MAILKVASSNETKIEKNVPLPGDAGNKAPAWPLRQMEVGDSFSFDPKRESALRSAVNYEKRVSGTKFSLRKLPHESRCWRIA